MDTTIPEQFTNPVYSSLPYHLQHEYAHVAKSHQSIPEAFTVRKYGILRFVKAGECIILMHKAIIVSWQAIKSDNNFACPISCSHHHNIHKPIHLKSSLVPTDVWMSHLS